LTEADRLTEFCPRRKAGTVMNLRAESLSAQDLALLEKSFITADLVEQAGIFRVDSQTGAELVGRNGSGDYSGLIFPFYWPGEESPREYRIRRDNPDLEQQPDGSVKEKGKYLSPPGRSSLLYFMPGIPASFLANPELPIVITEGEKKTLALYRLAFHERPSSAPRFLGIGLSGVWNWRGCVGKATDQHGVRRSVKGVIPDFDRITWEDRTVYIIFDANVTTNDSVEAARNNLAKELERRSAHVSYVTIPLGDQVNGVDDLLGAKGPDYVLGLIAGAQKAAVGSPIGRKSQATTLVELGNEADLFHTPDGEPYASIRLDEHVETWSLRSRGFRDWLIRQYYQQHRKTPSSQALQDALGVIQGQARYEGSTREVHTRIAEHEETIYLDLADEAWRVVRISADGWHVISADEAPIRFRRPRGLLALPEPVSGDLHMLRRFVNVTDEQWPLIVAWLVSSYRPNRPFPILALHGEQGSAKSTTARVIRALVDPNKAALRSEPRSEHELMIAATNSWLVLLDNVSRIPTWLSDALCRLSTGGGFAARELYQDSEEIIFDAMRPVLINGIEEVATRSDLLDRTLIVTLPSITDAERRPQDELLSEFTHAWPTILGALMNAVTCALGSVDDVHLDSLPRMADFAIWATAAEPALGLAQGEFMIAYVGNRESANDLALEAAILSAELISFIQSEQIWSGTTTDLLSALNSRVADSVQRQPSWPKSPRAIAGKLTRIAPNLRAAGINVQRGEGRKRREWTLEMSCNFASPSSQHLV
jgi:hypothetical protein